MRSGCLGTVFSAFLKYIIWRIISNIRSKVGNLAVVIDHMLRPVICEVDSIG